jgi:hypothetical protein
MATLKSRLADLEAAAAYEAAPSLTFSRYGEFDADVTGVAAFGGDATADRLPGETVAALLCRAPPARVRALIYSD